MGFARRHRQSGSLLALAALALQIMLSFGHVHLDTLRVRGSPAPHAAVEAASAALASTDRSAPSPADDADDYCAICASIFLVSNLFAPDAPQLPAPGTLARIDSFVDVALVLLVEPPRPAFRSRAPPRA